MISELALLALGYTQPPHYIKNQAIQSHVYVERVQSQVPVCQDFLDKSKKGILSNEERVLLEEVHEIKSIEEALTAFPQKGAKLIPNITYKTRLPFSWRFYRYPTTKNEWDIAILISGTGIPIGLYHAKSKIYNEYALVAPGDTIFDFYRNLLDPDKDDLDVDNLKRYISHYSYTCSNKIRLKLEEEFNKATKEKSGKSEEKNPKMNRPKIKKQNFQLPHKFLIPQKVIRQ